jgi:hypothetical protein
MTVMTDEERWGRVDEIWSELINIKRFNRMNGVHRFAHTITANGIQACIHQYVLMSKPVMSSQQSAVMQGISRSHVCSANQRGGCACVPA